jgi:TonB family protein
VCAVSAHYAGEVPRGIQGLVQILITVSAQGTVEDARVVGAVEQDMVPASLRAVNDWKLKPAVGADGVPFPARVMVALRFTARPPDTAVERTVRPR